MCIDNFKDNIHRYLTVDFASCKTGNGRGKISNDSDDKNDYMGNVNDRITAINENDLSNNNDPRRYYIYFMYLQVFMVYKKTAKVFDRSAGGEIEFIT